MPQVLPGAHRVCMMGAMTPAFSLLALRNRPLLVAGLLGLATFLVFLPSVSCDFVNWDDDCYVYDNPLVLGGLSAEGVRGACTDVVLCCWAPLTLLSYQLDSTLFGTKPAGYHLTNVLLHAAAIATLYVALVRMTAAPGRTAAAILLFSIHPLRVESVAWIAERKDVLSVLLLGITLITYEAYCRSPCVTRYLAVCVAMAAGLLAKATLVTVPALLLLLDYWPLGRLTLPGLGPGAPGDGATARYPPRPWNAVLAEKLPLLAISAVFIVITFTTQQAAIQPTDELPLLSARLPNAVHATAWYVWKTFWPTELRAYYRHPGIAGWPLPAMAASVATLVALSAAAIGMRKKSSFVAVGLAWFAISLSPVIGIVAQQGGQAHADRYSYVPHIGLMIAVVWTAAAAIQPLQLPSWVPLALLTAVTTVLAVADQRQIATWKDSATLWNRVITLDPRIALAHCKLGLALEDHGQSEAAAAHYAQSLAADPAWLPARNNLAAILIERGEITEARPHVERALRGERDPLTFINLGMLLMAEGNPAGAAAAAREAIKIDPTNASACFLHGRTLTAQNLLEQAIVAYQQVVRLDPDHFQARNNLANLFARLRRFDEAIPLYRSIIARDPQADVARRNLAAALQEQARGATRDSRPLP